MTIHVESVREELADIADSLIAARTPSQPFGVYACRSDDVGAELGRFVERGVFLEVFGNTREQLAEEYGQYERGSVFLTVIDHARRVPAGMMRVLVPSASGFKSLRDTQANWGIPIPDLLAHVDDAWDLDRVWDLATLAVSPEYRGEAALGLVTQGLLQALTMLAEGWGVDRYVAILDVPVLRMLQWRIGRPFVAFPGVASRAYLGSTASMPVWGSRLVWADQLSATDPILHELFFEGRGLEPVLSTPCWSDAVALVESVTNVRVSATTTPIPER